MQKKNLYGLFAGITMLIVIFNSRTVISGVQVGITLCLKTIIPALFPFIILSTIISSVLLGKKIKLLSPIRKLCNIPSGAETILLLGFLGGYPIGAQLVAQAYSSGSITNSTAKRMLGFCSNAGPAFIFGIFSTIFTNQTISWWLWGIHITSAITVGFLLPKEPPSTCRILTCSTVNLQNALKKTIKTLSLICSWVILFRILICLSEKWMLIYLPVNIQVLLSGLLELSNGCIFLTKIKQEEIRFLYASIILSFGGLCVAMQTKTVTQNIGCRYYFLGKLLQTLFALLYSIILLPLIYDYIKFSENILAIGIIALTVGIIINFMYRKKLWHLQEICSIIPSKIGRREQKHAVSKKNASFL